MELLPLKREIVFVSAFHFQFSQFIVTIQYFLLPVFYLQHIMYIQMRTLIFIVEQTNIKEEMNPLIVEYLINTKAVALPSMSFPLLLPWNKKERKVPQMTDK